MLGDVVYVERRTWCNGFKEVKEDNGYFRDYGIEVGNNKVIHFVNYDEEGYLVQKVVESSMDEFSRGLEVKLDNRIEYKFNKIEALDRAFSRLNRSFGNYHMINNNCESFVLWCTTGKKELKFNNDFRFLSSHNGVVNVN
ncbi:lecithin retinol acyltransferase family protein [Clostridium sp. MSJ-8]|uniref:lecithin retinol acyltransferase family protein n=1 Tax=Clostridium sp. MSJ-8 TaxID=2841510 RepID=UPI001C0ED5CD|nr:lecithin retinol acyltransferase family protein [Clostridium sp. MSJ-8]MBU5488799.1 lecithin retinol acyltransferase family protein [Clostridium sp. MSJ-8]